MIILNWKRIESCGQSLRLSYKVWQEKTMRRQINYILIIFMLAIVLIPISPGTFPGKGFSKDLMSTTISEASFAPSPQVVIISGSFAPAKGAYDRGLVTLTIFIHNTQRKFVVKNIESQTSNAIPVQILDQIIPRNLKFIGNEEILSALSKPGLEGKCLRLKGWLYTSSRVFYVSSEVKNS